MVIVEIPADAKKRRTIDRLARPGISFTVLCVSVVLLLQVVFKLDEPARYVAQEGFNFEKLIMQRESPEEALSHEQYLKYFNIHCLSKE